MKPSLRGGSIQLTLYSGNKVLLLTDKHMETRNVKHALSVSTMEAIKYLLPTLEVCIINNPVTCAIYRARPYPSPPECFAQTLLPYTFIFSSQLAESNLSRDVTGTLKLADL